MRFVGVSDLLTQSLFSCHLHRACLATQYSSPLVCPWVPQGGITRSQVSTWSSLMLVLHGLAARHSDVCHAERQI